MRPGLRGAACDHQRRDNAGHNAGRQHGRGDPQQPGKAQSAAGRAPGGQGLHGLARAGGQLAEPRRDHHRPGRRRSELAGAPGRWTDQGRISRRLGPQGGHLSGGQTEHLMAAQHPHGKRYGVRGALCDPGLLPMPVASSLRPRQARAAHCRNASARALRSKAHASTRKPRCSGQATPPVQGSRARMPRPSAAAACAGAATLALPKRACSTSLPRLRSIWSGLRSGVLAPLSPKRAAHVLPPSKWRLDPPPTSSPASVLGTGRQARGR